MKRKKAREEHETLPEANEIEKDRLDEATKNIRRKLLYLASFACFGASIPLLLFASNYPYGDTGLFLSLLIPGLALVAASSFFMISTVKFINWWYRPGMRKEVLRNAKKIAIQRRSWFLILLFSLPFMFFVVGVRNSADAASILVHQHQFPGSISNQTFTYTVNGNRAISIGFEVDGLTTVECSQYAIVNASITIQVNGTTKYMKSFYNKWASNCGENRQGESTVSSQAKFDATSSLGVLAPGSIITAQVYIISADQVELTLFNDGDARLQSILLTNIGLGMIAVLLFGLVGFLYSSLPSPDVEKAPRKDRERKYPRKKKS